MEQKLDRSAFGYKESKKNGVSCGTCEHYDADRTKCGLFESLNDKVGELFNLDEQVSENDYCKAHQKMKDSIKNLRRKSKLVGKEEEVKEGLEYKEEE